MNRPVVNHICTIDGCDRKAVTRQLCKMHYSRWVKTGDTGRAPFAIEAIRNALASRDRADCWLWKGANRYGYGVINHQGRTRSVPRLVLELDGKPTGGPVIRHVCDVPACWNPDHLIAGTHAENVADKVRRNRQQKGTGVPSSALTEDDVRAIRSDPRKQREIADAYGISQPQVSKIKRRLEWAWLD